MNAAQWEQLSRDCYLRQPIDALLIDRLTASLPQTAQPDAREAFVFGVGLLCSSLNRGDTFLPVETDQVLNAVVGWLALPENSRGEIVLKGAGKQEKNNYELRIANCEVMGWVRAQWQPFVENLRSGVYNGLVADTTDHNRPMVFDKLAGRLYFDRYYEAVTGVNALISSRIGDFPFTLTGDSENVLIEVLKQTPLEIRPDERQSAALLLALQNKTLLISGGPGTGKTTVVLQILRLFLRVLPWLGADMIRIVAPTGRAAARMQESIAAGMDAILKDNTAIGAVERSRDESLRTLTGSTVHRLLVYNPSTAGFGHGKENPLDAAVVIVDEVSMLDIELFARLLDALPRKSVLILLGDRFQLPSVEAGAVLGDLADGFDRATGASLSAETAGRTKKILGQIGPTDGADLDKAILKTPQFLRDRAVILTRSHRSIQNIQKLANAINTNDRALELITAAECSPVREAWPGIIASNGGNNNFIWIDDGQSERPMTSLLAGWIDCHFGTEYAELVAKNRLDENGKHGEHAFDLLKHIEQSRVLCVLRDGMRGATGINLDVRKRFCRSIDSAGSFDRFAGLPILIARNNARIELYNGDCGVLLRSVDDRWFGLFRRGRTMVTHPLDALPAWESAFATTVHKSQGSEYERVLLILPAVPVPICTREIIYTAVTRAKSFAGIVGSKAVLQESLGRTIRRNTGVAVQ